MAGAKLIPLQNKIKNRLDSMIENLSRTREFLERVVYPTYLRAQMKRWMTEGRSDGYGEFNSWKPLSTRYAAWKRKRFASAPGGGRKILIATGYLFNAVIGKGPGHRKLNDGKSLVVGVDVPYAKYVNETRPFFIFSDEMMDGLKDKHKKFVADRGGMR